MAYLTQEELQALGLKKIGANVLISSKACIYEPQDVVIGSNVRIDDFCVLSGNIEIHNFVHLACHVVITATKQSVSIGDFSTLSYGVKVFSASDDFSGENLFNPTVNVAHRNVSHSAVEIGNFVAIGAGSVIFPGVKVGEGTAVGALSLLNKSCDPWKIYAGSPAREIGKRSKNLLRLLPN